MATHSSILAWRIPWTKEPGGLQSMGSQTVRHNRVTKPKRILAASKATNTRTDWKKTFINHIFNKGFQFSCSSHTTLCNPMDCSKSNFPVNHQLQELAQIHIHQVRDAIQPSHPLSSPSPSAFNLSQHQGLFQGVGSSHQVTKVLEFQLQHQSFQ